MQTRQKHQWWFVALASVAILISSSTLFLGCGRGQETLSAEGAGRNHLRNALIALDKGDDVAAESELKLSIAADPLNSRARVTLASIYAKQGGMNLLDWLDAYWDATSDLTRKIKTINRLNDIIDNMTKIIDSTVEAAAGRDAEVEKRASEIIREVAKASFAASLVIESFQSVPTLNQDQLQGLDKAIEALREKGLQPLQRSEEVRVYLSLLSFVRLVNNLKRVFGNVVQLSFETERDRFCTIEREVLKGQLHEVDRSLRYLEEGMMVSPNDPMTKQRKVRERVREFVSQFLRSETWDNIATFFDETTVDGKAAKLFVQKLCKI